MTSFVVLSNRLNGLKRGDVVELDEIEGDVAFLIEAGHISPQASKKSAKTKDTDTKE